MSIFTLQSVRKDFGIKEILKGASFSIDSADKVGIIGTNGSGKSTLLRMIAGLEPIDGGKILVNPGVKIVYLPQQPEINPDFTIMEQIFADSSDRLHLIQSYHQLSEQLSRPENISNSSLMAQFSQVSEQMEQTGAWELETQAQIALTELGITDFTVKVGSLSGGFRKRIALVTALLSKPDVLLMDEPTNHLDALSVEWLQSYLNRFAGALLLITHDRYFLDKVTNRILEIDQGEIFSYSGNYSYFLEKKALALESIASSEQKHKGVLRRELEWLSRGPKARSTKQKARIQRVEALRQKEFKTGAGKVEISTLGRRIGKKVVELVNVSKTLGDRQLISNFSYEFSPEDRVGIIGGNGVGKSTLLNLIIGKLAPDQGKIEIGSTIHIGYFDQHSEALIEAADQSQRAIDYIKEEGEFIKIADGSQITASQMLERFLFPGSQQYAPIQKLSGGEKRRLFLLRLLMGAPNLLILDEPTNDLDVQTLSVLEEYLEDFNGCAITVSHDRYFLDRVVDTILCFEGEGKIRSYSGNYSIYLEQAAKKSLSTPAKIPALLPAIPAPPISMKPRKLSYKEKREIGELELKIEQLEQQKQQLEHQLNQASHGYSELLKQTDQLHHLTEQIHQATERWLELSELDN
ncbi:MAG: ABC-F family ATP-binding cassette domain-containing protein [Pseudanabaenaceae cyanobacterium bins.68]|nr:ABC-F family ATP-binding cassette domain-containing protein [Pseudanabaenaceae cyanobacterium bins.68]